MLIFTRRIGEKFMIGKEIKVAVLGIVDNQVRIGVEAPKNVAVHREEIYYKIMAEENNKLSQENSQLAKENPQKEVTIVVKKKGKTQPA